MNENGKKASKIKALRIPKIKPGEGMLGIHPDLEAFIVAELAEREERGWSQQEVADKAGVERGTIQHLEHRRRGLGLVPARAIARAFGHGVDSFIEAGFKRMLSRQSACFLLAMLPPV